MQLEIFEPRTLLATAGHTDGEVSLELSHPQDTCIHWQGHEILHEDADITIVEPTPESSTLDIFNQYAATTIPYAISTGIAYIAYAMILKSSYVYDPLGNLPPYPASLGSAGQDWWWFFKEEINLWHHQPRPGTQAAANYMATLVEHGLI